MQRAALPFTLVVTSALMSTGCLSPYIKKATDAPDPKPSPALVGGFVVRFDSGSGDKSLLEAAADAAQNSGLDEFGKKAATILAEKLAAHGYTAAYDQARTSKLDAIQISSNAGTAALTGQWRHPEASYWVPQTVDSLFVKPNDIVGKLKVDGTKEFFAFVDVTIFDAGMILKEPYIVVRTAVYDENARKVLDLQGIGRGESTPFISNRSPANLEVALNKAFESLTDVAVQPLAFDFLRDNGGSLG